MACMTEISNKTEISKNVCGDEISDKAQISMSVMAEISDNVCDDRDIRQCFWCPRY